MMNLRAKMRFEAAMAEAARCRTVEGALGRVYAWAREEFGARRSKKGELLDAILDLKNQGLKHSEIAREIGCSVATVKRVLQPLLTDEIRERIFDRYDNAGKPPFWISGELQDDGIRLSPGQIAGVIAAREKARLAAIAAEEGE